MNPLPEPKFISLEGGEGTGKSTQAALLTKALRARGIDIIQTREPGGCDGAEEIRRLLVSGTADRWNPMCELLLHFAARCDHVAKVIEPALANGQWVVSDRFTDSSMAYQGIAQGLGRDAVSELQRTVLSDFSPDLTLILDLPIDVGLARVRDRGGEDRYERMDPGFHRRLRQAFLDIAKNESERCAVVDASPVSGEIHANILGIVRDRLGLPDV